MPKYKRNIQYEMDLSGREPNFFMSIGFDEIKDLRLSIGHRLLSNHGSGLIRHTGNPTGIRTVNGIELKGVYGKDKENARIYHNSVDEHLESLGLKDKDGRNLEEYIVLGNGNLGNNYWHVAWQKDKKPHLYYLDCELLKERTYTCFVASNKGKPTIQRLNLSEDYVLNDKGEDITNSVNWCNYGQQIVRNGSVVPIEEIADQSYDIRHIFDLKDWGPTQEKDVAKLNELFEGYPIGFREKVLKALANNEPRARYDHHILGLTSNSLIIAHQAGTIEEIAASLIEKGVEDAIVLDQGGSSFTYASWVFPCGAYIMQTKRFRPLRISTIGIVLKNEGK